MREEKRRRTRDEDFSAAKKRRDDSPSAHYSGSGVSSSKSRSYMPVSERQQFALLKLMETKSSSDRGTKQAWDGQEGMNCGSERSTQVTSSAVKVQSTLASTTTGGSAPGRYCSPHQDPSPQAEKSNSNHSHSHCHHGLNHFPSSSSSHHSSSRKSFLQQRSNDSESPLMRASKKGDLLTLKMMVKEGGDVNEQDINGRTALHESSLQNFLHVVSYLLKHNANPNVRAIPRSGVSSGTGDTPLHEAAREGHIRIIRALLRYGADPKICNNSGDQPVNLCPNEASQLVFKQSGQSRDYPNIANTLDEQGGSGGDGHIKRRSSPELPSSSPVCNQAQQYRAPNSPHLHSNHHHHRHHSPNSMRRNTVSGSAPFVGTLGGDEPIGSIHQLPRLITKKDPYAFDDEEVEMSSQPNQEVITQAPTNSITSTSSSPLQPHRFSATFVPSGTAIVATGSSLHISAAPGDAIHSGPSSLSPTVIGSGGPPLKLRFAIEAGHYTVMENQENSSEQAVVTTAANVTSTVAGSAISDMLSSQEEVIDVITVEESKQGGFLETNLKQETAEKLVSVSEEEVDRDSDDGRAPRVPPLRIKLGNSSPPPQQVHHSSLTLPPELDQKESIGSVDDGVMKECNDRCEKKQDNENFSTVTLRKPEPPSKNTEIKEEEERKDENELPKVDQEKTVSAAAVDDDERKADSAITTTPHHGKRGVGSVGKVVKVTPNEVGSTKRHGVSELSEIKSKEMSEVVEDASRTRSFRTLRSHTAAQREKEEREKSADVAPLKKRKYRSKGGNGGSSGAEGGGEVDTGKTTDPEDAGTTNEASSLRSGSTNGDTVATVTADDDTPSPVGEVIATSSCSHFQPVKSNRVFDDPNKPSMTGWGENPYEKAAELNRGLSELIGKLVELQPKEPTGYQDYLLVTKDYLLAGGIPQHIIRHPCPAELPPPLVDLFEEQEDERYAQALKHQSEREQLRLCAEQSVLRAQTRATIALANQPRPLSFCSVMALKGFTYLPPFKDPEHREEENVRDRFKARTLIGWLQDIKDNFHLEKRKLLCRQLHEAESLMVVQKLDWEVKLKEMHLYDYRANIFDQIPTQHVPLVRVPTDFPLFVHDPVQRPA